MKRVALFRTVTLLLLGSLFAALVLVGGCKDKGESPDTPVATDEAKPVEPGDGDADTAAGQPGTTPADGSAPTPAPNAPSTMTVRLAWVENGENALGVERSIAYSPAVATAAMNALLAGPTAEEQATWPAISSAIPAGTRLLGVSIEGGIAKVDLSKEFESGGGTFSVTARLAQVVYTLTQFPGVTSVDFFIEGVRVEMFSSEGLILDGPQTIEDYQELLPMDA